MHTFLKELMFPLSCLGCGREGDWVCGACMSAIATLGVHECPVCHKPTERGYACPPCITYSYLSSHIAMAPYETSSLVGQMIRALKYDYAEELAPVFSQCIRSYMKERGNYLGNVDLVLPVPLHPKRLAQRGFNQAALLATIIGEVLEKPVLPALTRRRYTAQQARLTKEEREKNIFGAFLCTNTTEIVGRRILLVDDVFTTGATMQECARILLIAGAEEVIGWSLARGE